MNIHIQSLAALALVLVPMSSFAQEAPWTPTMTLTATGSVSTDADLAVITLGMQTVSADAGTAMQINSEKMNLAFATLEKHGVNDSDLSTSSISLTPRYETRKNQDVGVAPEIVGYHVSNQLVVTVQDVGTVGDVIDSLVNAGINSIQSIQFAVADKSEIYDNARKLAAREVNDMARIYADSLGATITGVINVIEASNQHEMYNTRSMMMDSPSATPVAAGDVSVSVKVTVTYSMSSTLSGF